MIVNAMEKAGYIPGKNVFLALDPAASEFYKDGRYHFEGSERTSREMIDYYRKLVDKYPIVSIEDGLAEDDWEGWKELTKALGEKIQLVGDDIFVTNPEIFTRGVKEGIANSILIKLNQIGTLSQTFFPAELINSAGIPVFFNLVSLSGTFTFSTSTASALTTTSPVSPLKSGSLVIV